MDLSPFCFSCLPVDQSLPSTELAMLHHNGSLSKYARGVVLPDSYGPHVLELTSVCSVIGSCRRPVADVDETVSELREKIDRQGPDAGRSDWIVACRRHPVVGTLDIGRLLTIRQKGMKAGSVMEGNPLTVIRTNRFRRHWGKCWFPIRDRCWFWKKTPTACRER